MTIHSEVLCYPDGAAQEAPITLGIHQIVDLNGIPLDQPLPTIKMIVYRVYKITKKETRAEAIICYHLELVRRREMFEYV